MTGESCAWPSLGGPTRREFVSLLSSTTSRRERVKTKNEKQTIIDFASRFPPRHFDASRLRGFEASLPRDLADFHNNHENVLPKHKTCCPNHVGYSKISPRCGRMHQDVSDRKSIGHLPTIYIEALSYIYRTSIERLSSIYRASIGMPNLVRAKTRRQLRGDPTAGMWRRKSWRGSGRRSCRPSFGSGRRSRRRRRWGIAWILFLAAWQGCADGDVIVRCWETAKDVRYSRSMFIGRRMVDRFSIYRRTEVR